MAVIPEAIKYVAIIYKPSFFVAVAPEAIKYVAFIYKPSLTLCCWIVHMGGIKAAPEFFVKA